MFIPTKFNKLKKLEDSYLVTNTLYFINCNTSSISAKLYSLNNYISFDNTMHGNLNLPVYILNIKNLKFNLNRFDNRDYFQYDKISSTQQQLIKGSYILFLLFNNSKLRIYGKSSKIFSIYDETAGILYDFLSLTLIEQLFIISLHFLLYLANHIYSIGRI